MQPHPLPYAGHRPARLKKVSVYHPRADRGLQGQAHHSYSKFTDTDAAVDVARRPSLAWPADTACRFPHDSHEEQQYDVLRSYSQRLRECCRSRKMGEDRYLTVRSNDAFHTAILKGNI